MSRRWLVLVLVLLSAAILLRQSAPRAVEWVRRQAEAKLTSIFHTTARIGAVEISWLPLELHVSDLDIGGDAPTLKISDATLAVQLIDSLHHSRVDATLSARGVLFNLDRLPKPPPAGAKPIVAPSAPIPFEIVATQLEDVAVQFFINHEPVTATAAKAVGRVGMSHARPYLTFAVHAPGATLQRAARQLVVTAVDLDAGVLHDQFFVDYWTVRGDSVAIEVTGEALPPAARHHVVGDLPFESLAVVFEPLGAETGSLHVDGICHGELFDPIANADVHVTDAIVHGEAIGDVHGTLTRRGRDLALSNVQIEAWGGTATATVNLTVGGHSPVQGQISWSGIDAALIGHLDRPAHEWSVLSEGRAELTGTLEPVGLMIQGDGSLAPRIQQSAAAAARWSGQLGLAKDRLTLDAQINQGPNNRANAALTLTDGKAVGGTIDVTLGDVAKLAPLTPPPLRDGLAGSFSAQAAIHGPIDRPTIAGTVAADALTVFGATIPALRGQAEWTAGLLATRNIRITTANGAATIDGVFALTDSTENNWRLSAQNVDFTPVNAAANFLGMSVPLQGGVVDGTATCRGPWSTAQFDADLRFQHLWLFGEPLHGAAFEAHGSSQTWTSELRIDHAKSDSLIVRAQGQGTRQVHATGESTAWQLSHLRGAGWRDLDGTVALHATVDGPLDRLGGSLRMEGKGLTIGGHALGDALVVAQGNAGLWSADADSLTHALRLHGTVRTGNGWPVTLTGELQPTDLAAILLRKSSVHIVAGGSLDVHGNLSALNDVGGELQITSLAITRQSYGIQASEPIIVHGEHGRFEIRRCSVSGTGSAVSVTGGVSTAGLVDLKLSGSGDLELIELLLDPVQSARGRFSLAADLQRDAAGLWRLQGNANINDGDLDAGLPVAVANTEAAFTLSGGRIVIEDLAGRMGGGTFRIGGAIDVNTGPNLWWSVTEVAVPLTDGLEARVSGQGKLLGTWRLPTVSGDLEVLTALYDRNLELGDLIPWLKNYLAAVPQRETAPGAQVALDLRVYAHDGVFIDNNVAKVEMWLNLQVTGTSAEPQLTGTIGFLSGEVIYADRTFTVTGGSIDFRDAATINPVLNITAESQVTTTEAEYTIRVIVSGRAESPRVQFTADDPALSQNDILSLVAFGKTATQLQREGGKLTSGSALALIPTGPVEQQVRRFAGLDRFEIEATQAQDTGTIEPRITVGKDLTEQLRANVSNSFGVEQHRTVQLEYRLTPRFSLVSSWESDSQSNAGAFGGGVKFRYEFRRLPLSLFYPARSAPEHLDAPSR